MGVGAWTFVMVGLSFAIYIGVAVWSRARSTGEFYVAGGRVPAVINGMATAADWMSAASFISMAGLISFMGRDGSAPRRVNNQFWRVTGRVVADAWWNVMTKASRYGYLGR